MENIEAGWAGRDPRGVVKYKGIVVGILYIGRVLNPTHFLKALF